MDVTLTLHRASDALLVSSSSVFARAGENFVYVVSGEGEAKERQVELGTERDGKTEVTKGLREGERVVVDGTLSLADGSKIQVVP